jgi:UDPglucose 6-dehydrogenase
MAPALLEAAASVNARQVATVLRRIEEAIGALDGLRVAVLGLSFKPGTDDVRHSPAIALINALCARGAQVACHDPVAATKARSSLDPRALLFGDIWQGLENASCAVLATDWPVYRELELARLARTLKRPRLFDARNAFDPEAVRAAGIEYHAVGRAATPRRVAS